LQLAEIVALAHKLNPPIVHRDLKPANILVKRTPEETTAFKIADFGIGGVAANQIPRESARGTTQGRFLVSAVRGSFLFRNKFSNKVS
jgi:serine/threonine protein kinase